MHQPFPAARVEFCKVLLHNRSEGWGRKQAKIRLPLALTSEWRLGQKGHRSVYMREYGKTSDAGPFYVASPDQLPQAGRPRTPQPDGEFAFPLPFLWPDEQLLLPHIPFGVIGWEELPRHVILARPDALKRRVLREAAVEPALLGVFLLRALDFGPLAGVIERAFPELPLEHLAA